MMSFLDREQAACRPSVENRLPLNNLLCCDLTCSFFEGIQRIKLLGIKCQRSNQSVSDGNQIIAICRRVALQICLVLESVKVDFTGVEGFVGKIVSIELYQLNVNTGGRIADEKRENRRQEQPRKD